MGHDRVTLGRTGTFQGLCGQNGCGMSLIAGQELVRGLAKMGRRAPAVFGDIIGCIFRAPTQVEAVINPRRYPALTGEKGMAYAF
jgi:hypothetical protein